jgi:hypothetical protein
MLKTTRMLLCKLTADEKSEREAKASELDQEKRKLEAEKKAEMKARGAEIKHLDKQIAALTESATKGEEQREVECEERESLVNGSNTIEVVRLDTLEVIETIDSDPEPMPDSKQPGLPFASPPVPSLPCTAIDADGVPYGITAEQVDAFEREKVETPSLTAVFLFIDGIERAIVRVLRSRACEFCSAADGNHRPECKGMKADAEDDANDTAAVAARIAEVEGPNDLPLVPPGDDAKPLVQVKPKRTSKKNGKAEGAEA